MTDVIPDSSWSKAQLLALLAGSAVAGAALFAAGGVFAWLLTG